jgi:hypothetical protein
MMSCNTLAATRREANRHRRSSPKARPAVVCRRSSGDPFGLGRSRTTPPGPQTPMTTSAPTRNSTTSGDATRGRSRLSSATRSSCRSGGGRSLCASRRPCIATAVDPGAQGGEPDPEVGGDLAAGPPARVSQAHRPVTELRGEALLRSWHGRPHPSRKRSPLSQGKSSADCARRLSAPSPACGPPSASSSTASPLRRAATTSPPQDMAQPDRKPL